MRLKWIAAVLAVPLIGVFLMPGMVVIPRPAPTSPCEGRSAELVVHAGSKRMWFCEGGQSVETFRVGLGRGGVGKRNHNDDKTPLGEYSLGAPHASPRFHLFVPVGYPTAEQRREGYSGSDVGIHGPVTWMRWSPVGATWVNRTRGCIEVAGTAEIERVAGWVRSGRVKKIYLE
jgi:L,D-transpeptidase catalytic domain